MKSPTLRICLAVCGAFVFAPLSGFAQSATAKVQDVPSQTDSSSPFWQEPAIDQEYYVKVDPTSRTTFSFLSDLSVLKCSLASLGAQIDTQLVGTSSLYLRFSLPSSTNGQRQSVLQSIEQLPLVSQLVADRAVNIEIHDLTALTSFSAAASVSENKMRGFRDKEAIKMPDLSQPHTSQVLLVKYSQLSAYSPGLLSGAQNALHTLHGQLGATIMKSIQTADTPIEVVLLPPGLDIGTAVLAYEASPVVEYAHLDCISQATSAPPSNDPAWSGTPYSTTSTNLWHLNQISAPEAWLPQYGGITSTGSLKIAVTDTGIDYNHSDFTTPAAGNSTGNLWPGNAASGYLCGVTEVTNTFVPNTPLDDNDSTAGYPNM